MTKIPIRIRAQARKSSACAYLVPRCIRYKVERQGRPSARVGKRDLALSSRIATGSGVSFELLDLTSG